MQKLGKYELIEKIGAGGFGEVFRAYDPFIKRHVAAKTCTANHEGIRERFFQEAEIAGNLHHRNVTTVYDFGVEGELPYLIQEYLGGEDLDRVIKRKDPLGVDAKLEILIQIACGLAHAHDRGIIHRDIKPANIRVLDDATVKIMDFGIARLARQDSGLTQTGMTLGTAAYLSPEQIRGGDIDERTDVFSLGVLAYELFAYQRPFVGAEMSQVVYQLLNHEPTPLAELGIGVSPALSNLIDRCLEKSGALRPRNAGIALRELESLRDGAGADGSPLRADRRESSRRRASGATVAASQTVAVPRGRVEPTIPGAPPGRSEESDSFDDHEWSSPQESISAARRATERPIPWTLILVVAAALVAAAGGWTLGNRGSSGPVSQPLDEAPGEVASIDAMPVDPAFVDPADPSPAGGSKSPGIASTGALTDEPASPAIEPPPARATVVLPRPPWTRRMTVTVDGRTLRLDRRRSITLDPGDHRFVFRLDDGDYQAEGARRLQLDAGSSTRLESPIAPPSRLTIRPFPRRPQGEVWVDGARLAPTPLRAVPLSPGPRRIEIRGLGPDAPRTERTVTLAPGIETVITFDLDAGSFEVTTKPSST